MEVWWFPSREHEWTKLFNGWTGSYPPLGYGFLWLYACMHACVLHMPTYFKWHRSWHNFPQD